MMETEVVHPHGTQEQQQQAVLSTMGGSVVDTTAELQQQQQLNAVNELHHQHQQQQLQQQQLQQQQHSLSTAGGLIMHTSIPGTAQNHHTQAVMTFTDSNKGWDMLEFHRRAREHEKYCDAVLHVHGRQFLCHRLILAANSAYFDSIFQSRIAKTATGVGGSKLTRNSQYYSRNPCNSTRSVMMESLIISCTEPELFQIFLNYMYTGQVTIDKGNVAELLRLSNNFMVAKLKEYCAEYLERFLDAENCLQVKEVGEKYRIGSLAKSATSFVQNNLGEVINHEIMMELLPKQVENFVTEKAWSIPPDASVKFMSRWVCHDLPNRERDFKQLLTHVDWNMIDPNVIVEYIDQEPLYGSSERCFYYVLHSLAEKGIQVQKYEQMYQALQQRFGQEADQPLGYGENLLQMAFNSAMEGLQVPPESSSWSEGRDNNNSSSSSKWNNENDPPSINKPKKEITLEQRRRRILRRIQRNRAIKRWVVVRLDRPKTKKLGVNEIAADSSGDEECDPVQTKEGYRCHLCPFASKKISRLERHLACIHAHDVTYRCSECGFTCKWNREYFLHMKGHFEGPPYKCGNCEFTANKIGSLIGHRVTHLDLKPYHCTDCDFKSRTKANLAVHLKIHNNEKPYSCGICGRNFASKNSLDQHAVGHNTDKTYSCTQCPFSTKYLNHFTNHKKTHHIQTGKKGKELYRCSDPQCKYTTSKKSQLDSHMRSHAGVRPHVCGICGRRFLEKSHLVRHERIHFNERPFKCEECDYASTRRDKLKEHKTRHHGANASAKSPYKPRPHKGKAAAAAAAAAASSGSGGDASSNGQNNNIVYAKKSNAGQNSTQASSSPAHQQQIQQSQQQQQEVTVGTNGGDLEFIIPHSTPMQGGMSAADSHGAQQAFAQLTQGSTLDLQQMTNAGIVQLRQYQPVVNAASSSEPSTASASLSSSQSNSSIVTVSSSASHTSSSSQSLVDGSLTLNSQSMILQPQLHHVAAQSQQASLQIHHHHQQIVPNNNTTVTVSLPSSVVAAIQNNSHIVTHPGTTSATVIDASGGGTTLGSSALRSKSIHGKSRFILVQQGKPSETIQVAQTLASFPGTISAQELQRTLGLKLEDLQGHGIIGIQGGTARAIKLEDLTGSAVQVGGQTVNSQGLAQTIPAGARVQSMVLDAAQLQQLAQAAASVGGGGFERGIPITISSVPVNSSASANSQQVQVSMTNSNQQQNSQIQSSGTQQAPQQQGNQNDFSNLSNLFC